MNVGELVVRLRADLRNFTAGMTKATATIKTFTGGIRSSMATAARIMINFGMNTMRRMAYAVRRWAKIAALAITGIAIAAVKMATSIRESENRFRVIMGDMADEARAWSAALSHSLKMHTPEVRNFMATYKEMMQGMGLATQSAYDLSKVMTILTYDVSSFAELSPEEAFNKLTSALVGMPRPLQTLGYNVKEVAIQEEALRIGLVKVGQEMTEQQKVIARVSQMMRVMTSIHTDAKRTLDDAAPTFRTLWQQIKTSLATIGEALLPVVHEAAFAMREWLIANQTLIAKWAEKVGAALRLAGDVFVEVVKIFQRSPREGFQLLLDTLIEVIEAAGRIAVDMAIRIGRGIWAGVKEGVFGEREKEIARLQREIYRGRGGAYAERQVAVPSPAGLPTYRTERTPTDEMLWLEAEALARAEAYKRRRESILGGFGETAKAELQGAFRDIATSNQDMNRKIGESLKEYKARIAAINDKYANLADETMPEFGEASVNATEAISNAMNALNENVKATTSKWKSMWADASGAIAGAMETAFADIVEDARNATQAIENMLRSIQRAISQAFFQQYMVEPIFAGIRQMGIPLVTPGTRTPGVRETQYQKRGGMVYAQRGLFVPKGSDTVPAMLTPGEGVLDRETTSRLRRILSVPEPQPAAARVVNINVQAIDAAGTYQFFQRNKRNIASMLGDVQSTNHPIRRSGR